LFNQGNDVGRQYRSAIFYADDMQRGGELYMDQIERAGVFDAPLATELVPLEAFCVAEDYHHDYAAQPGSALLGSAWQLAMVSMSAARSSMLWTLR
jgi:peptide methionine sulfoxide reductase MsrA